MIHVSSMCTFIKFYPVEIYDMIKHDLYILIIPLSILRNEKKNSLEMHEISGKTNYQCFLW